MTATATKARPLPSTTAHLDALTSTGAEGFLIISAIVNKNWRSASFATDEVDDAARWAARADTKGLNVYVRSNLLNRPLTSQYERGSTEDTGAAVALAVDLDVAGPGHAPGKKEHPLPPDLPTAMRVVAGLPEPTLNILTGGGAHLWWLLDEPEVDDPIGLIETWADRIVQAGAVLGWHVDRPDAARVLRVCGTHRRKKGIAPNLVTLGSVAGGPDELLKDCRPWTPSGRYGAQDLLDALPIPPAPEPPSAPTRPRREGEIGPADAVARLSWSDILEPLGWTYIGPGRMGRNGPTTERWRRPGATSDHSIDCIPDGPCVAWSDACGLPVGKGQKLNKWKVYVALHHGGDESGTARMLRQRAREVARHG